MHESTLCEEVCPCLTHVELTEELQPSVTLRGGKSRGPVGLIQLEDGLLHIPLSHDAMPLVIIEGHG